MFNTWENIRKTTPLIHHITNYVTVNDVANITLACGASPVMADDEEEAAEQNVRQTFVHGLRQTYDFLANLLTGQLFPAHESPPLRKGDEDFRPVPHVRKRKDDKPAGRYLMFIQPRSMVWSRSGPTATMVTGTPACSSMKSM